MKRYTLLLSILASACGEKVAPSALPVRFVASLMDSTAVPFEAAALRAESTTGEVIEARTASDGSSTLMLSTDARWDVTFAGEAVYPLSILGLRPTGVSGDVRVLLRRRPAQERRLGSDAQPGEVVPRSSQIHHLTVRVRNYQAEQQGEFASFAGPFVGAQQWSSNNRPELMQYDYEFASYPGAPAIELWVGERVREEQLSRAARSRPHRGVFARISPRPTQNAEIEIDYRMSVPAAPERTATASWMGGVLDGATVADNAAPTISSVVAEALPAMSGVAVGQFVTLPGSTSSDVRFRSILFSDQWTIEDASGLLSAGRAAFSLYRAGVGVGVVQFAVDPRDAGPIRVPLVATLEATGTSVANTEFAVAGAYPQAGFEILTGPEPDRVAQRVWEGWLFDAPSEAQATRFRVPRLPSGYSLAQLATTPTFFSNAFVSTLPRSTPGFQAHRTQDERIRVRTGRPAMVSGDR